MAGTYATSVFGFFDPARTFEDTAFEVGFDADVFESGFSDPDYNRYVNIYQPGNLSTILACGEVGLGANAQWR